MSRLNGHGRAPAVIKVVCADELPVFRDGIAHAIEAHGGLKLVASCGEGREAAERIRELEPEIALLDLLMPDVTGIDVIRSLGHACPTKSILLSAHPEPHVVYDAVAAGAAGYLDKSATREQICEAICAVARGGHAFTDGLDMAVIDEIPRRNGATPTELTLRETEVLRLVARGVASPAIADRLNLSESTVKTHLRHAYEKLGVAERAAAVAEAMRRGILV
jgi:two-component system, NarL family, nitrate/nitrite response regulator NarL